MKIAYQIFRDVDFHRLVGKSKYARNFAHAVRAIVKAEQGISI